MRRFDKNENMRKANLLAEQRYLTSKGLINESYDEVTVNNIDENRFKHWKRQYEELLRNPQISNFVNNFKKYRDQALGNVEFEVKPAFSDVIVRFVDKDTPSTQGRGKYFDPKVNSSSELYESGQIMFQYNDTTCIFDGVDEGDAIKYTYSKSFKTDNNPPWSQEGKEVARTFENLCKNFSFKLLKEEVPTRFYSLK